MSCRYLTLNELANKLGIAYKTAWRKKEQFPGYFVLAGMIRYDEKTLDEWIEKNRLVKPGVPLGKTTSRHGL